MTRRRRARSAAAVHPAPFDFEEEIERLNGTGDSPETLFEKAWTRGVFALALRRLHEECASAGKAQHYALLEQYDLAGERPTYAELAHRFGIAVTDVTNTCPGSGASCVDRAGGAARADGERREFQERRALCSGKRRVTRLDDEAVSRLRAVVREPDLSQTKYRLAAWRGRAEWALSTCRGHRPEPPRCAQGARRPGRSIEVRCGARRRCWRGSSIPGSCRCTTPARSPTGGLLHDEVGARRPARPPPVAAGAAGERLRLFLRVAEPSPSRMRARVASGPEAETSWSARSGSPGAGLGARKSWPTPATWCPRADGRERGPRHTGFMSPEQRAERAQRWMRAPTSTRWARCCSGWPTKIRPGPCKRSPARRWLRAAKIATRTSSRWRGRGALPRRRSRVRRCGERPAPGGAGCKAAPRRARIVVAYLAGRALILLFTGR